jgi:hypothetical protein
MVITARKLELEMGINSEIAHYFANERKVPVENAFWKNKRIYLSSGFGFLTIPLIFDLTHKAGVPIESLLVDKHVSLMERGFDKLKQYENNDITFPQFLNECRKLLDGQIIQEHLATDLFAAFSDRPTQYFTFETTHRALARSDSFLFTLVDLNVSDGWVADFLPIWYSLARPILLLDDFKDLEDDRVQNDENTIIELGNDRAAIQKAYEMGLQDCEKLETINAKLAKYMRQILREALLFDHIRKELN